VASWEVQDAEQKSEVVLETQDVIRQLASGNVGIYARVRQSGESQWKPISQIPEFYTLCPWVNPQYESNDKIQGLGGYISLGNDVQKLISVSARVRATKDFYTKVGFHVPIYDEEFQGVVNINGKINRLWDNFWVGPILSPARLSISDVGHPFLLRLFAINTDKKRQEHQLHPHDYPIPDDQMAGLTISVPAGGMVVHKVRIPVDKGKGVGVHVLTFRNVSTGDKIAKGALVGALTLGTVVYKQGHRSFGISLQVVEGPTASAPAPPVVQGKICVKCSRMNSSTAQFCAGCGNRLG